MRIDVLTLFPDMFPGYLGQSLLKRAIERGLITVNLYNLRDWASGRHRVVDDTPYGGGPGMILKVEPVVECVEAVQAGKSPPQNESEPTAPTNTPHPQESTANANIGQPPPPLGHVIMLTPQGRRLCQPIVEQLAAYPRLLLMCGRYEGFDDRVRQILQPDEISIGDFVLGGGEVAAMVVIDAVIRLVPGVLGDERSPRQDSFSGQDRWLEFAQYTRPREYRGLAVPDVLLGGNHEQIDRWRKAQSLEKTQQRRSDLLDPRPD